jgi:hypothetical protein
MKTPYIVYISRLIIIGILAVIGWLFIWHAGDKSDVKVLLRFSIVSSIWLFALVASFIRSIWTIWFISLIFTMTPLAFWLYVDITILKVLWWEYPFVIFIQNIIPIVVSCIFFTNKKARSYYR